MKFKLLTLVILLVQLRTFAQFTPIFGRDSTTEISRRQETFFFKGKQQVYDSNSRLIAEGKLLLGKRHGRWKYYDQQKIKTIVRYRFGEVYSSLRTTNGKKVKLLLGYGKPMYFSTCQEAIDKYRVKRCAVAGCRVNNKILFRVEIHNIPLYIRKSLRYGFNWQEKITEYCRAARQKK